jgi:hypothetical protein
MNPHTRVLHLHSTGMSARKIAALTGIDRARVGAIIRQSVASQSIQPPRPAGLAAIRSTPRVYREPKVEAPRVGRAGGAFSMLGGTLGRERR